MEALAIRDVTLRARGSLKALSGSMGAGSGGVEGAGGYGAMGSTTQSAEERQ